MPSLTLAPTYSLPNREVRLRPAGLNSSTNKVELYWAAAPEGSEQKALIDKGTGRQLAFQGSEDEEWRFTPSVPGVYVLQLDEYLIRERAVSVFQNDPRGAPAPTLLASTTVTIPIGEKMTMAVGEDPNSATLIVYVWQDTIRRTTVQLQGEASPTLERAQNQSATSAAIAPSVVAKVDALIDQTASTVIGTFSNDFEAIRAAVASHMSNTSAHTSSDVLRALGSAYTANSPMAAKSAINALRQSFFQHIQAKYALDSENVSYDPMSPPTPSVVHSQVDGTTVFLTSGAGDSRSSQYLALADLYIALSTHKGLSSVHTGVDANPIGSTSPLLNIFIEFLSAANTTSPTPPSYRNAGAALLEQLGGFEAAS